ncbi:MAG: glycosyltransferase [Pyrinomonadaceae bacterium]|nr:glycosyltransferase [Pyrinomonadaceae bacterium]
MTGKILKSVHITNYYHKNSGGISTAYDRLLEAANRHRRYVRLIVPGAEDAREEIGEYGRIYYVKAKPAPVFDKRYRLLLPFHYLQGETPVRKILETELPDIIEIGEKYTLSLLAGVIRKGYFKSLNRPMLVHFSCERMDDNLRAFVSGAKPFKWFSRRLISNYIFPMFDYHLANSQYTAQEMIDAVAPEKNRRRSEKFFNFSWRFFQASNIPLAERVFVNNCGADNHLFDAKRKNLETRKAILAEAGFPENATVLLYAGRISPEKNVKLLPQVLKSLLGFRNYDTQCREYRLLIVGSGPQADLLEAELEKVAPGKFKFFGHISDKEKLADIYANSDIFLHPNPREPFGIGPLEAMASGLPVVAPDSGGVLSYATRENAWLEEADTLSYFAAVRDVFSDDEKREIKIRNAIETARTLTWENSTDKLFALYDKMYADFSRRRELHVYEREAERIDFAGEMSFNQQR